MPGIATAIGVSIRQIKMFDLMQVNHGGEITHAKRAHPELRPARKRWISDRPTGQSVICQPSSSSSSPRAPRRAITTILDKNPARRPPRREVACVETGGASIAGATTVTADPPRLPSMQGDRSRRQDHGRPDEFDPSVEAYGFDDSTTRRLDDSTTVPVEPVEVRIVPYVAARSNTTRRLARSALARTMVAFGSSTLSTQRSPSIGP